MSKILRRLLAVALLGVASSAAAAPCLPGTLTDYMTLGAGGCELGTTSYVNFDSLAGIPAGATPIAPDAIQVVPVLSVLPGLQISGFVFVLAATVPSGLWLDALIHFQVMAGLGAPVAGARAILGGADATGDGAVTLIEDMCLGGTFASPPVGCSSPDMATLLPFAIEGLADTDLSTAFAAADFIDVVADIGIDGGPSGTARLGSAELHFLVPATAAPEPPALPLAALALAVLAVFRRRQPLRAAR